MRTLATISSAEGTLAIPPESEEMTVSVWLIKITGGCRNSTWGEKRLREKCIQKCYMFLMPRSAQCKNTDPNNLRAGRDLEDNSIQLPHFTDMAGNKMTCPRSHSVCKGAALIPLTKILGLLKTNIKIEKPLHGLDIFTCLLSLLGAKSLYFTSLTS